MKNYHILLVRHISPSNKKMYPRVRIKSELHKQSILIPYTNDPGEISNPLKEAEKWLKSKGFPIIGTGELNHDFVIIVDAADYSFQKLK